MTQIEHYNAFCSAACLNHQSGFRVKRRETGLVYATILITSGNLNVWWAPYVGLECLALLQFKVNTYTKKEYLEQAFPVRLLNTKFIQGRGIDPNSFSII